MGISASSRNDQVVERQHARNKFDRQFGPFKTRMEYAISACEKGGMGRPGNRSSGQVAASFRYDLMQKRTAAKESSPSIAKASTAYVPCGGLFFYIFTYVCFMLVSTWVIGRFRKLGSRAKFDCL